LLNPGEFIMEKIDTYFGRLDCPINILSVPLNLQKMTRRFMKRKRKVRPQGLTFAESTFWAFLAAFL